MEYGEFDVHARMPEIRYLAIEQTLRRLGHRIDPKMPVGVQPSALSSAIDDVATKASTSVRDSRKSVGATFASLLGLSSASSEGDTPQAVPEISTSAIAEMQRFVSTQLLQASTALNASSVASGAMAKLSLLSPSTSSFNTASTAAAVVARIGALSDVIDIGVASVRLELKNLVVTKFVEQALVTEVTVERRHLTPMEQPLFVGSASGETKNAAADEAEREIDRSRVRRDLHRDVPADRPCALYLSVSTKNIYSPDDGGERFTWHYEKYDPSATVGPSTKSIKSMAFETLTGIKNPFALDGDGNGSLQLKQAQLYALYGVHLPPVPAPSLFNRHPKVPPPVLTLLDLRVRVKSVSLNIDSTAVSLAMKSSSLNSQVRSEIEEQLHNKLQLALDSAAMTKTLAEILMK
jgi:hypothetical protein